MSSQAVHAKALFGLDMFDESSVMNGIGWMCRHCMLKKAMKTANPQVLDFGTS